MRQEIDMKILVTLCISVALLVPTVASAQSGITDEM